MTNKKPLLLLVAVPLLLVAASSYFQDIDAAKSQGTLLTETGSDKVCGDKLCSEVDEDNKSGMDNESMTDKFVYQQDFLTKEILELDLKRTALFITDPQNDFLSEGVACAASTSNVKVY